MDGFYITPDNGKIYYKTTGNNYNNPVIVIFPGGPGMGHELYEQKHMPILSHITKLLFFDPRGCGKSSRFKKQQEYTMKKYVDDVYYLIKHLKFNKISILGTSYGSMAALNFAIEYPNMLDRLILVGGAPSYKFIEEAKINLNQRGTSAQKEICEKLWKGNFYNDNEVKNFFKIMGPLYSNRAKQTGTIPYKAICALQPLNEAFKTNFWYFDFIKDLEKIKTKTLILVGEDDWINPPSQAKITARGIKNARLKIIKNSGHSISIDQPEQYKTLIQDFIK